MNSLSLPLEGKRILVTRPGTQGQELADKLKQAGAQVILAPLIEIVDPDSWQELDEAIDNLLSYHWLFFASSNAVVSFVKRLEHKILSGADCRQKLPRLAVIGEATANTARQHGLPINYCPDIYVAEEFVTKFPGYPRLAGTNILWPRTNIGRDLIMEELQEAGANVHVVAAYKTILPANAQELSVRLNQLLKDKQLDVITLASNETALNLARIISRNLDPWRSSLEPGAKELAKLRNILSEVLIVTIGPQTSAGALNYLGKESLAANPHTIEGMLAALKENYNVQSLASGKSA
jgi:uroporphyrinogen III methyltransferase/synthase